MGPPSMQVYIYGGLDTGPIVLTRNFGMAWGVGGWLLTPFLQSAGAETIGRLRARWLRSSPRRSRVPTRGRFHSPACSGPMRSTATSSERPGRSSSLLRKRNRDCNAGKRLLVLVVSANLPVAQRSDDRLSKPLHPGIGQRASVGVKAHLEFGHRERQLERLDVGLRTHLWGH